MIIDIFGGIKAAINGANARMGRVEEDYPHGDLLQRLTLQTVFDMASETYVYNDLIYGPDPHNANAEVWEATDPRFDQRITLPGNPTTLLRGPEAYADGIVLPAGCGLYLIAADCALIVVVDLVTEKVVVAHGAIASALDLPAILQEGRPSKLHSVVDSIMARFTDSEKANLRVMVCFSIHHSHFEWPANHPQFGLCNQRLIGYLERNLPFSLIGDPELGQISLQRLFGNQFLKHGMGADQIFFDKTDTFSDRKLNGTLAYQSARRHRLEIDAAAKEPWSPLMIPLKDGPRNFILVSNGGRFLKDWKWHPESGSVPWSELERI